MTDEYLEPGDEFIFDPVDDHVDGTDISSVVTPTKPTLATKLMIQALDQNLRLTLSAGVTPTTTKGFQLKAGDPAVVIPIGPSTTVKVIEEAATCDPQWQWGR